MSFPNPLLEKQMESRQEMMDRHGWIVDSIFDNKLGIICDTHTHGLTDSFSHPDLQCVLPMDPKVIHALFCAIVNKIKNGQVFRAGKCYSGIVKNYKVRFVEAIESDRRVLRMILPDQNGKLHRELMEDAIFKSQYDGISPKKEKK